jgi:hypothetical protein
LLDDKGIIKGILRLVHYQRAAALDKRH